MPRLRRVTRSLPSLLAALAALALLHAGTGEARADAAQATVVSPGGEERPLALEALPGNDVVERTYALRGSGGESHQTVTGASLGTILEAAGADPFSFSYLEVQRPGGGSVLLSRYQALDPGAFADGPPVVYATPTGTGFIRPGGGPDDLNAADCFESPQGLRIVLRKGTQLRVRASATPVRVKPGERVAFSAGVEGVGSGELVSYAWTFGDGKRLTDAGSEVSHSFAQPGSYAVVVGVTTPGNETGASAVVRVQVGRPPAGGPDREGGGHNKAKDAPDQGAAAGPAGGTTGGGSAAAIPPPATSFPESVPSEAQPGTSPQPQKEEQMQPAPEPSGEEVSGVLIGSTATAAPEAAEPAEQVAARTGSPDGDGGSGGGLPDAAWGLLATAGLLGTGALIEMGGLSGLLARRRWMAP